MRRRGLLHLRSLALICGFKIPDIIIVTERKNERKLNGGYYVMGICAHRITGAAATST
jgi:hypothetical protein